MILVLNIALLFTILMKQQAAEHTIQTLKDDDLDIVTELSPAPTFYPAEDYHQNYYEKNPSQGYCNFVIPPKLLKLHSKFQHLMKINK